MRMGCEKARIGSVMTIYEYVYESHMLVTLIVALTQLSFRASFMTAVRA